MQLTVAVNKLPQVKNDEKCEDDRLVSMLNFIQTNYQTVTLEDMAEQFHLSEPYISKYIKDRSGQTFRRTCGGDPYETCEEPVKKRKHDG